MLLVPAQRVLTAPANRSHWNDPPGELDNALDELASRVNTVEAWNLGDLNDVELSSPADKHGLLYQSGTSDWRNERIPGEDATFGGFAGGEIQARGQAASDNDFDVGKAGFDSAGVMQVGSAWQFFGASPANIDLEIGGNMLFGVGSAPANTGEIAYYGNHFVGYNAAYSSAVDLDNPAALAGSGAITSTNTTISNSSAWGTLATIPIPPIFSNHQRAVIIAEGNWKQNSGSSATQKFRFTYGTTVMVETNARTAVNTSRVIPWRLILVLSAQTSSLSQYLAVDLMHARTAGSAVTGNGYWQYKEGGSFDGTAAENGLTSLNLVIDHQWSVANANTTITLKSLQGFLMDQT